MIVTKRKKAGTFEMSIKEQGGKPIVVKTDLSGTKNALDHYYGAGHDQPSDGCPLCDLEKQDRERAALKAKKFRAPD